MIMTALMGMGLSSGAAKLLRECLIALVILGVVYAGYLYVSHLQQSLAETAIQLGAEKLKVEAEKAGRELVLKSMRENAEATKRLEDAKRLSAEKWNSFQTDFETQLPESEPETPHAQPSEQPSPPGPGADPLAGFRSLNSRANRMLEHATDPGRSGRGDPKTAPATPSTPAPRR